MTAKMNKNLLQKVKKEVKRLNEDNFMAYCRNKLKQEKMTHCLNYILTIKREMHVLFELDT